MKNQKTVKIVHSPKQRFWGIMALVALFGCGVMVGVGMNSDKVESVNNVETQEVAQPQKTCVQIEELLAERLPEPDGQGELRIIRAKIFAQMSERGCPENSEKYVALAKQELEIARALEDDEFDQYETIEVVETYKRLDMQAAAEEILETAKKLTNPAIDFILEVEKIINEQ
ncbi:MAG: hypothetical protein E7006_02560 [Alphaproteobacteria bacterium]|nr:hypothetical protein [Alphaproteobacteria bacterium]